RSPSDRRWRRLAGLWIEPGACNLLALGTCELSTLCIQSGEITQYLAPMVKKIFRPLRGWPIVETFISRLAGQVTTWSADDFGREVHLIPAAGGWRTLCYPTRARMAAGH